MTNNRRATRRVILTAIAAVLMGGLVDSVGAADRGPFKIATFAADVTPPLGHPLIAGWRQPAKTIKDRLSARGVVLLGGEKPIVWLAVDWCELRNDAYDRWRDALAEAAGTTRARVLVSCLHQHDAPYIDLYAQKLMDEHDLQGSMFDPKFHEDCVQRTAEALKQSLKTARSTTHYGIGQAKVEGVASNRRVEIPGRPVRFNRSSFTRDLTVRNAPAGEIDPLLKTLSFFEGDKPLAAISSYATHPMSYYGRGEVSYDFVGLARDARQRETPGVFQVYVTGCSGDITAAKYNDGTFDGRVMLGERLQRGMQQAWKATKRHPLTTVDFRVAPLKLKPESNGKYAIDALEKTLANKKASQIARSQAALGLSWHRRCAAGQPIDVPVVDFGKAIYLVMPAEAFVAYQLAAQKMRPDVSVVTAAFGESAPGYTPTAKTRAEGFVREHGYCWVAAGEEEAILAVLRKVLLPVKTP